MTNIEKRSFAAVKVVLLSLLGALVYHAIQVHGFMTSPWGLISPGGTSFLHIFYKTMFEAPDVPALQALSGRTNLAIGGAIGFGIALALDFARLSTFAQPDRAHPEASLPLDSDDDNSKGDNVAVAPANIVEPEDFESPRQSRLPSALIAMLTASFILAAFAYFGFVMIGELSKANGSPSLGSASRILAISITDLQGEWFNRYSGGRSLRFRGALLNYERNEESLETFDCGVVLRLHFDEKRPPVEISGKTCGTVTTLPPGEYKKFEDADGTNVDREWLDYGVSRVEARVLITAKSALGKSLSTEMQWTEVPLPSSKSRFFVDTNAK